MTVLSSHPASSVSHTEPTNRRSRHGHEYRFPTDAEMTEAICHALEIDVADLADGRRRRRVNHIIQLVQLYHREARASGHTAGLKKRAAAAAALWPVVRRENHLKTMLGWEQVAERAGLLRVQDGRGERALRWELLADWQRYAGFSRGYSSVGPAIAPGACEARRRRETRPERHQRRVRPHCRRVGNKTGAVGRLELGPVSFFGGQKFPLSGLRGDGGNTPPRGGYPPAPPNLGLDASARGAVEKSVDAIGPGRCASAGAAPIGERLGSEAAALATRAEQAFEAAFGAPAAGPLLDWRPLFAELVRYDRAAARVAALNGWREMPPGERAVSVLEALIAGHAEDCRRRGLRPPRHLGWFVPALRTEARRLEAKARERRADDRQERAVLGRRLMGLLAVELVERLREPDPARGGRGSRPRPRRGSGARRSGP